MCIRDSIDGMHEAGMRSTGKHFPGHGGVYEDSHLQLPIDNRSMEDLKESDIKPYTELKDKLDIVNKVYPNKEFLAE